MSVMTALAPNDASQTWGRWLRRGGLVCFGSLADISGLLGMSALPLKADMNSIENDVC
jgi:hypothetical protein